MHKLSIKQIISKIESEEHFEAIAEDQSFRIKIEHYVPYMCAAIHDGHQFRPSLKQKTVLTEYERWYEEDPHTADFITSFPIVIAGMDSRFEYDLNRGPENCVYKEAWGKQVWKKELPKKEIQLSLTKHKNFYKVIDAIVKKLESKFGNALVYDIHSYNYKRHEKDVPLFNIGTENVDQNRFGVVIEHWKRLLSRIDLGSIENRTEINDVFYGRGYFLKHITERFENTLVLATEVKKVYCNELTGESHHNVIEEISEGMKDAIIENVRLFSREFTNLVSAKKTQLLSSNKIDDAILTVDKQLFKLVHNFELLNFVNPINLAQEKKRFFKSDYSIDPVFKYRPLVINPWDLKRKLSELPIEKIKDVNIRKLYEDVIFSYYDKIDMLNTLGTPKFLYNSLRYFGEPDQDDINNAYFLMYCQEDERMKKDDVPHITSEETAEFIRNHVKENYNFDCKIELMSKITSKALVLNSKQMVVIKKNEMFTETEVNALAHHEVGVHMVTTMNSINSQLKIFNMGLPKNTLTQEGLAVLSEYLSGNLNIDRLKELALRVLCIKYLIKGYDFNVAFKRLLNKFNLDPDFAWYVTARVYRGGGFTKDYLYLQGFKEILKLYKNEPNFHNLLIGKTSFEYLDTINEMVDRKFVDAPRNITLPYLKPEPSDDVLNYVVSCIR